MKIYKLEKTYESDGWGNTGISWTKYYKDILDAKIFAERDCNSPSIWIKSEIYEDQYYLEHVYSPYTIYEIEVE